MDDIRMRPIGTVHNDVTEATDEAWGKVISDIRFRPELAGVADGLETFTHCIVLYWMHQTPPTAELRRRPRGRKDMPELGLLAQRARHRPNPIGITAVEVVGVTPDTVRVRGLDAIDGTPVLDLKPYYPEFDRRDAAVPEWARRLMEGYF